MNRKLRKILAGGLAVVLLFAVAGCGAGKSESVAENAETKQETVVLETEDSSGALTEEAEEKEAEETEAEEPAQGGRAAVPGTGVALALKSRGSTNCASPQREQWPLC